MRVLPIHELRQCAGMYTLFPYHRHYFVHCRWCVFDYFIYDWENHQTQNNQSTNDSRNKKKATQQYKKEKARKKAQQKLSSQNQEPKVSRSDWNPSDAHRANPLGTGSYLIAVTSSTIDNVYSLASNGFDLLYSCLTLAPVPGDSSSVCCRKLWHMLADI